jgi:hypothetical protein
MRVFVVAAAAALTAGCGSSAQPQAKAEGTAAALQPGEYALTWTEVSRDPAAKDATAAAFPAQACVAADGFAPDAFADEGDSCHAVNSYVRNGIVNVQLSCAREGKGKLSTMANGSFAADAFEADVETTTAFDGSDNYTLKGKVSGKRTGACQQEAAQS